jgi:hypothetical protein
MPCARSMKGPLHPNYLQTKTPGPNGACSTLTPPLRVTAISVMKIRWLGLIQLPTGMQYAVLEDMHSTNWACATMHLNYCYVTTARKHCTMQDNIYFTTVANSACLVKIQIRYYLKPHNQPQPRVG